MASQLITILMLGICFFVWEKYRPNIIEFFQDFIRRMKG